MAHPMVHGRFMVHGHFCYSFACFSIFFHQKYLNHRVGTHRRHKCFCRSELVDRRRPWALPVFVEELCKDIKYNQNKSNKIKTNQTKSNQKIKTNQTKSNQHTCLLQSSLTAMCSTTWRSLVTFALVKWQVTKPLPIVIDKGQRFLLYCSCLGIEVSADPLPCRSLKTFAKKKT